MTGWHIRNDLLRNTTKTEALVTGTRQQVVKLDQSDGIPVFGVDVPFISKLQVLGVMLNCHLPFDDQITSVIRVCNDYLSTGRLQTLKHYRIIQLFAQGWIIATLFSTKSPN